MKKMKHKRSVGKVLIGVLIGGVVGATMGWLTAPASGVEIRRRLKYAANDSRRSIRAKVKTAEENVESKVRDLIDDNAGARKTAVRGRKVISTY